MQDISPLFYDLTLILIVAGVVTIIFKALKQPLVLGYIVAGMLTGPYIKIIPTAHEIQSVEFWGKIGVIFLLFGLGLEFSFKKLKKVGGPGFMTVFTEVLIMFCMGYLVGNILGWSTTASIFLGAMLTISSTSIIIKAFDDLQLKNKKFTHLVFGALVVEDLVAILMLVILPALAISNKFDGAEFAVKILNLALFLLLWFTGGVFLIPTLFTKLKKVLTDETLIVVSLGLCLGMVVITIKAGISEALGAFVMGSILSGTLQSERIIKLIKPIQDFFGAIFFVSVGMLVNPSIVLEYWPEVLLISLTIIIAKPISATIGLMFSGQTLKIAMQSGLCLCQIGEFSFIIAAMGKQLHAIPDYLYPVIVSVSIITTFVTPYWIKLGDPLYNYIYNHVKPDWQVVIERLGTGRNTLNRENDWNKLIRSYIVRLFVYCGWILFMSIFCYKYLLPMAEKHFGSGIYVRSSLFILNIILAMPFLYGLLKRKDGDGIFNKIWADKKFARGPLLFMMIFKYLIAIISVSIIISVYIFIGYGAIIIICALIISVVIVSSKVKRYYAKIESHFLSNLNSERGRRGLVLPRELADEIHFDSCEIEPDSVVAGKTITEIHNTYATGALIIRIYRGNLVIDLPQKIDYIFPWDKLLLLGTDKQIYDFRELSESKICNITGVEDIELFQVTINEHSPLIGLHANISDVRNSYSVLVIGLEKANDNIYIRPTSANIFEAGDTLWVVGTKDKVKVLEGNNA